MFGYSGLIQITAVTKTADHFHQCQTPLQRHAAVVVQKSLAEGFGLTVAEGMWKGRPVVGSAVGGIQDQIVDGRDAHLVIAGADPSANGATATSLKRLSTDLGLENHIRFPGEIQNSAWLLPALDVFVSASHTESFGLAMVEAMACGLPLVATNTDGANEVITENQTGFIVPIGAHEELAASIITLLNDAQLRVTMGRRGHLRARECFGLKRMVDAIEEIYSA